MELNTLANVPGARKQRKRVGRGPASGNGKTSGRGCNGQKSRSGYSRKPGFEGGQMPLNRRLPKRGFYHGDRFPYAAINLDQLDKAFEAGAEVTFESLAATGLFMTLKGGVKILGRGKITKALIVKVNAISEGAKTKIEAAGGSVELTPVTPEAKAKASEA